MSIETKDIVAVWKKRPVLVVSVGLIALCLVGYYLRSDEAEVLQARLDELQKQEARLQANVTNEPKLDDQLAELQRVGKDIRGRMLNTADKAQSLQLFLNLETASAVRSEMNPGQITPLSKTSNYVSAAFNVTITGTYRQALDYLRRLEGVEQFVRFGDMTMRLPTGSNGSADSTTSLNFGIEILGQK